MGNIIPAREPVKTWTVGKGPASTKVGLYFFVTTEPGTEELEITQRGFTIQPIIPKEGAEIADAKRDQHSDPLFEPGSGVAVANETYDAGDLSGAQKDAVREFLGNIENPIKRKLEKEFGDQITISRTNPEITEPLPFHQVESLELNSSWNADAQFLPKNVAPFITAAVDSTLEVKAPTQPDVYVIGPQVAANVNISINPATALKALSKLLETEEVSVPTVATDMQAYYESKRNKDNATATQIFIDPGDAKAHLALLLVKAGVSMGTIRNIVQDMDDHYNGKGQGTPPL